MVSDDANNVNDDGKHQADPEEELRHVNAEQGIERVAAGACNARDQAHQCQDQRVFIAAFSGPEASAPAKFDHHRHQHACEDAKRSQRTQEAERKQEAPAELAQSTE